MRSTDALFKDIYETLSNEDDKDTVLSSGIMNIQEHYGVDVSTGKIMFSGPQEMI
jgi:hypothetical protein